jgi:hypothetical protein
MKGKIVVSGLVLGMLLLSPVIVSAQGGGIPQGGNPQPGGIGGGNQQQGGISQSAQLVNPISYQTIPQLVTAILQIVVKISAPLLVFFLVYVGFLFVMARGNPVQLQTTKRALVYALVGGLMLLGAFTISEVICRTVGNIAGQSASQCLIQ